MCWCRPNVRTPCCGRPECHPTACPKCKGPIVLEPNDTFGWYCPQCHPPQPVEDAVEVDHSVPAVTGAGHLVEKKPCEHRYFLLRSEILFGKTYYVLACERCLTIRKIAA